MQDSTHDTDERNPDESVQSGRTDDVGSSTDAIRAEDLTKIYDAKSGELVVFSDLSTTVRENEFVSLIGPSGCGKTTLLRILAGLEKPTDGIVFINGNEETEPNAEKGFVFQEDVIFPWKTVAENVRYGPRIRGWDQRTIDERVDRFLDIVGLSDYGDYYPKQLSGGMRKRVAIAMVFANDPQILFMDEPFASLDYVTKNELQGELLDIWRAEQKTTVFVTHDLEEAAFLSDRILVIGGGEKGIVKEIEVPFNRPRDQSLKSTTDFQTLKDELWTYIKE